MVLLGLMVTIRRQSKLQSTRVSETVFDIKLTDLSLIAAKAPMRLLSRVMKTRVLSKKPFH